MAKTKKSNIVKKPKQDEPLSVPGLTVDERGEPVPAANDTEPDSLPYPDDELTVTPGYETPPSGEGP